LKKILSFVPGEKVVPKEADCRGRRLDFTRTRVMGVINVTPDSFSDGGRFHELSAALEMYTRMSEAGADIIDIGGESTRPGSGEVDDTEELLRVMPILEQIDMTQGPLVSIDTRKPIVARAALEAGVHIVNDVSGFGNLEMIRVVAEVGAAAIVMHMKGEPRMMQEAPVYENVVREVAEFLEERASAAERGGVGSVWVDPGIGFGKSWDHNLEILRSFTLFNEMVRPLVIGVSRKTFIGQATGVQEAEARMMGSKLTEGFAVLGGADVIRTHDVPEATEVIRMAEVLARGTIKPE